MQEGVDAVLFMNWRIVTAEAKEGMGRKITKGKGNGARVLYTEERPAALAKNRYRMPYRIDLPNEPEGMFGAVSQHIPFFSAPVRITIMAGISQVFMTRPQRQTHPISLCCPLALIMAISPRLN